MHRRAALLLSCALAAVVVTAAPAPVARPWFAGWGRPVDPAGDCQFDRQGDKLTIHVPGGGHGLEPRIEVRTSRGSPSWTPAMTACPRAEAAGVQKPAQKAPYVC